MPRRSTRQAKSSGVGASSATELTNPSTQSSVQNAENVGDKKPKTGGQKRKASDDVSSRQPRRAPKKRQKANRDFTLMGMDDDVSRLIYSYLQPVDLLHLSRTSKDLRAFFMNQNMAQTVWKTAFLNLLPAFPECPSDLNLPQYADMAFGRNCHFCHRSSVPVYISWSARLRSCSNCIKKKFRNSNDRAHVAPSDLENLLRLLPAITAGHADRKVYYDPQMALEWKKEYEKAEDKAEWLKEKRAKLEAIIRHARQCEKWVIDRGSHLHALRRAAVSQRIAVVVARVKSLGWEYELTRLPESAQVGRIPAVELACSKTLTEEALRALVPTLVKYMSDQKQKRLRNVRFTLLKQRLPILRDTYNAYLSTLPLNALCPDIGYIFLYPAILDVLARTPEDEFTETSHVGRLRSMFPIIAEQWQKTMEQKLLTLYKEGCSITGDRTTLTLATTMFTCTRCYTERIPYPQVMMHSCAFLIRYGLDRSENNDSEVLRSVTSRDVWNANREIKVKARDVRALGTVVDLCGLNKAKTTTAEMNALDPIFECTSCNDYYKGRCVMRWSYVVSHNKNSHRHGEDTKNPMKLERLNKEEEERVRDRMNEAAARKQGDKAYRGLACVHCKTIGCSFDLRQHVIAKHDISNPTDQDIVSVLDSKPLYDIFWLWPPREMQTTSNEPTEA